MKKNYIVLLIIIGVVLIAGCTQTINQLPENISDKKMNQNSTKYFDTTTYCEKNSDCVIVVYGGCGTIVVNNKTAKNWSTEGPICEIGRYASNPQCENSVCVANYTQA